jgi:UDP-glucuronate 4-epimerase
MMESRVLITGAAGFIGAKVTFDLISKGFDVIGVDSFSTYYSPDYKKYRINFFEINKQVRTLDISDQASVKALFDEIRPNIVINLAAQGGVRASKIDPRPYVNTNQLGFINLIECAEEFGIEKFIYASSSSVYGDGLTPPFTESSRLPEPKSLYAASKISNELVAQYLPSRGTQRVGLRFFTVYGPLGRPDMAVYRLLASSLLGEPFSLTADLETSRDFTYVDDVAKNIVELVVTTKSELPRILNVAGSRPYSLNNVLEILDSANIKVKIRRNESDPLDSKITHGSTELLSKYDFTIPQTTLNDGLHSTWQWMQSCDISKIRSWYDYSA